jgi:LysM repeat protein
MKTNRLQTKRQPPPGSLFRRLRASTSRRHRVAAADAAGDLEPEGHVPHVGVARALLVILALHVVAIAGIFVHNRYFEGGRAAQAAPAAPQAPDEPLPKLTENDQRHLIVTGDTYESVAAQHGLEVDELRRANDNMVLRAGRILLIPPRRIAAVEPAELAERRQAADMSGRGEVEGGSVATRVPGTAAEAPVEEAPKAAVLVRAAQPVLQAAPPAPGGPVTKTYKVKPGDSLWRIAGLHGLTPEQLMKANGIKDPRRLQAGMTLKIPQS